MGMASHIRRQEMVRPGFQSLLLRLPSDGILRIALDATVSASEDNPLRGTTVEVPQDESIANKEAHEGLALLTIIATMTVSSLFTRF